MRTFAIIADDDADFAETMAMMVSGWGGSFDVAYDGKAAVTLALSNIDRLQLVILDMEMPGTSGLNAGMQIRSAGGEAPIIVGVSGNGYQLNDAVKSGSFDHCFPKPVDAVALWQAVARSIEQRQARQQREEHHEPQQAVPVALAGA